MATSVDSDSGDDDSPDSGSEDATSDSAAEEDDNQDEDDDAADSDEIGPSESGHQSGSRALASSLETAAQSLGERESGSSEEAGPDLPGSVFSTGTAVPEAGVLPSVQSHLKAAKSGGGRRQTLGPTKRLHGRTQSFSPDAFRSRRSGRVSEAEAPVARKVRRAPRLAGRAVGTPIAKPAGAEVGESTIWRRWFSCEEESLTFLRAVEGVTDTIVRSLKERRALD
jgi:hypothetical protein